VIRSWRIWEINSARTNGFTLIELLIVIAIIAILAAIAIPQFAIYRNRGFDAQVKYDLKNAALAQERFFSTNNNQNYQNCGPACTSIDLPGFRSSNGVSVQAVSVPGSGTFTLSGVHTQCGASVWTYNSAAGIVVPPGPPCG
jgi:prepilin-type N-terminal cleavage/methylation domain-containing protein